ncbi:MAG: hypothetical protein RLZZ519_1731 [Bacteroidota bacterium]
MRPFQPFKVLVLLVAFSVMICYGSSCRRSSGADNEALQQLMDSLRQDSIRITNEQAAATGEAQNKEGDSPTSEVDSNTNDDREEKAQSGWRKRMGDRYELLFPESWKSDTYLTPGIVFRIRVPMVEADDFFQESLNLVSQPVKENTTLATYAENGLQQIKEMYPNCKMIENAPVKGPNGTYHRMIYKAGMMEMQLEQCCWVKNGIGWVMTFTSEEKHFDEYKAVLQKITDSFVTY